MKRLVQESSISNPQCRTPEPPLHLTWQPGQPQERQGYSQKSQGRFSGH